MSTKYKATELDKAYFITVTTVGRAHGLKIREIGAAIDHELKH